MLRGLTMNVDHIHGFRPIIEEVFLASIYRDGWYFRASEIQYHREIHAGFNRLWLLLIASN